MLANLLVATVLVLQPVLDESGDLRLASRGTDDAPVTWLLDGIPVGQTRDGTALTISVPAGTHTLHALSDHDGSWTIMARSDPAPWTGATYVPSWSARHNESHDLAPQTTMRAPPEPGIRVLALYGLVLFGVSLIGWELWRSGERKWIKKSRPTMSDDASMQSPPP